MLVNGVDMNIKLTGVPEAFYLLSPSDDNKVRIKILDTTLFVTEIELKHLFFLLTLTFWELNAKFITLLHILRLKLVLRVLGAQQVNIDNTFLGQIPERILTALVKNKSFIVSASKNLFHFHHYDMRNLVLYVKGVQHNHKITLEMFINGFYILGYDLTPGREADEDI